MNEKIGSILKADGTRWDIKLLKVKDLRGVNMSSPDLAIELAAKSLSITREEFDEWDITDAMKAIEMVGNAISTLK